MKIVILVRRKIPTRSKLNIPYLKSVADEVEGLLTLGFLEYGMSIGLDRTIKLEQFKGKNHKGAREYPEQIKAY